MSLSIGEIFQKIQESGSFDEKKKIILNNNTPALRTYLRVAFDGSVRMLLPPGIPEVKELNVPRGLGETSLLSEAKRLYVFLEVDGVPAHANLKQIKRESLFLGFLSSFDNLEREYFKQLKEKTLDLGLSFEEINQIIPGLLRKENENQKKLGNDSEKSSSEVVVEREVLVDDVVPKPEKATKVTKPRKPRKTKAEKEAEKLAKE
jgi:hypothetical protein